MNETDIPFLTADNPVVKNGYEGNQGFSSEGIEIVFPITLKLTLIMREKRFLKIYLKFNN